MGIFFFPRRGRVLMLRHAKGICARRQRGCEDSSLSAIPCPPAGLLLLLVFLVMVVMMMTMHVFLRREYSQGKYGRSAALHRPRTRTSRGHHYRGEIPQQHRKASRRDQVPYAEDLQQVHNYVKGQLISKNSF